MSAAVALIALVGLFVSLVSIVFPLKFLYIHNRGIAMLVIVGSVIVIRSAGSNLQDTAPVESPKQVAQVKPTISDGCDFAGAIPNCREEMARLAAEEAAHPLPPRPATSTTRERPNPYISEILSAMQADENARKADEARAGLAALERQRRLDELDSDVARTQAALQKSIEEGKAQALADRLDVERAKYGLRVEQRKLERILGAR